MNPTLPEEAGQTVRGIVDALKAQPAVLALSLAQIAMLLFLFYALSAAAGFRDKMLKEQYEFAHKVTEILSRCVVPKQTSEVKDEDHHQQWPREIHPGR